MRLLLMICLMAGTVLAAGAQAATQQTASEPTSEPTDPAVQQVVVEPPAQQSDVESPAATANASSEKSTTNTENKTGAKDTNGTEDTKHVKPGNLNLDLKQSMKVFVPTEQIDVDKPVDFPTNI